MGVECAFLRIHSWISRIQPQHKANRIVTCHMSQVLQVRALGSWVAVMWTEVDRITAQESWSALGFDHLENCQNSPHLWQLHSRLPPDWNHITKLPHTWQCGHSTTQSGYATRWHLPLELLVPDHNWPYDQHRWYLSSASATTSLCLSHITIAAPYIVFTPAVSVTLWQWHSY